MMPNDNIEVVPQHQMVVAWIRLRQMKILKETKPNGQLKNSKLFLFKNPSNSKRNKNDIDSNSNTNNNNNNNNNNNKKKKNKMQRQIQDP